MDLLSALSDQGLRVLDRFDLRPRTEAAAQARRAPIPVGAAGPQVAVEASVGADENAVVLTEHDGVYQWHVGRPTTSVELEFRTPVGQADASLPADLRREVLLVFKESINNVARHSQCKRVEVVLSLEGQQLLMRVWDDGQGFDAQYEGGHGHGLASMRDRAQRLGGRLDTDSDPRRGTTVTLTVPLT